jgi:hypothetical protein
LQIIENSRTTARAAASWSFDRKSRNSDDRSIQFYRPPLLAEWLVDEKVVELVMGVPEELKRYKLEETHFELIRRAEAMLSLLADEVRHPATMFDSINVKGETVK